MKKNPYLLNTILAVFVTIALATMALVRTFQPAAILPVLNIPNITLVALVALIVDYFLAPEAERCYICIPVFSALTFGLLPLVSGFADINLAWPTAQIAVMGASGAVGFIYRKELKQAAADGKDVVAVQKEYEAEYEETRVNPYMAAERGFIDAVIPPSETRGQIIEGLRLLDRKVVNVPAKKHGNIPL